MSVRTQRIVMNGVTGRMGYRQHLVRSILAIRDAGGVELPNGDRIQVEPILVGRNRDKLAELAERHGVAECTTDLDQALADDTAPIYFDAQVTAERKKAILKAHRRRASTSTPRSRSPSRSRTAWSSPRPARPRAPSTAWCTTSSTCPGW